jgi:hypothetical protein
MRSLNATDATGLFTHSSPAAGSVRLSPGAAGSVLPWATDALVAGSLLSPYGGSSGWTGARTAPLALTALGDRMVVTAQPGAGPQGEAGVWLTIYRLEGNQLKKVGSTFDRTEANGARAGGRTAPMKNSAGVTPAPAVETRP